MAFSQTLSKVKQLVSSGEVRISSHGYDELSEDGIFFREIAGSLEYAQVVEDYPDFAKGPCVLVLQHDAEMNPIHVVWGIPKGCERPAVLVTAYKPDPERWTGDFLRRKS
jgi:hypothetical protein